MIATVSECRPRLSATWAAALPFLHQTRHPQAMSKVDTWSFFPHAALLSAHFQLPVLPGCGASRLIDLTCGSATRWWATARLSPHGTLGVHIERVEGLAAGHEKPIPLQPAEAEVGAALGQQDAAD